MHTTHLLAGLAGLTFSVAAPTPGDANALVLKSGITARQNFIGDALICSPDINPGPCVKVPANGACTDLPANVDHKVRTIYQNAGSHCEYFRSDNCQGRLGYSNARGSIRVTVPDVVGNQIGSTSCQRSAAVAEGAAGAETGYAEGEFVEAEVV